jgi:hypothetical protein
VEYVKDYRLLALKATFLTKIFLPISLLIPSGLLRFCSSGARVALTSVIGFFALVIVYSAGLRITGFA